VHGVPGQGLPYTGGGIKVQSRTDCSTCSETQILACLCCMFSASCSTPSAVQVKQLLDEYLAQFTLAPVLSEAELAHALLPSDDVVSSYVVAAEGVWCTL
jgi:Myristoyl-CoA:protein N-myristoyltransferase, C-terminal domain